MRGLVGWTDTQVDIGLRSIWKPRPLKHGEWPPDYDGVYAWRTKAAAELARNPERLASAREYYSTRPTEFIMDWMDTYDPRKNPRSDDPNKRGDRWMPFVFFSRQAEMIHFFEDLERDQESGLVEKCRDAGASWIGVAYTIWRFLFIPEDSVGWGSRKEMSVDRAGDPGSLFEKMRLILRRLPTFWLPKEFRWTKHSSKLKLINPENGSTVVGESGDEIGRGNRTAIYFIDEAAHVERPERVDAALGDTTNVRIDISSVNGIGNVFHRRREAGVIWEPGASIEAGFVRVFIVDWRHHPNKTQDWYNKRKAKADREGMQHIFAQEVERNYSASVSNTVIPMEWIESAIDAHIHIDYFAEVIKERLAIPRGNLGRWYAGLDVADEGTDRNALAMREWVIWRSIDEWGERDVGVSARRAMMACRLHQGNIECQYDSVGMGAGVKSEYNRLTKDLDPETGQPLVNPRLVPFAAWNASASVLYPFDRIIPDDDESLINKQFFDNLKAQAWWSLRTRFYKTHKARTEGIKYPPDELISLDSRMEKLIDLKTQLAQPTRGQSTRLKMIIEKRAGGAKSPNMADAGVMAFYPVPIEANEVQSGNYGY